jgi:hypothetical protein
MTTIVHLNGDGSGTIDHSMLITKAALAQIRQFSALGGRGQTIDFVSEDQARKMAATLGPGVSYVSSEAINTPLGEGRNSKYAFADINTLRISSQPEVPGGIASNPGLRPTAAQSPARSRGIERQRRLKINARADLKRARLPAPATWASRSNWPWFARCSPARAS